MPSNHTLGSSLDEAQARLSTAKELRLKAAQMLSIADEQEEIARRTLIDDLGVQQGNATLQFAISQLTDAVANSPLIRAHIQAILEGGDGLELPAPAAASPAPPQPEPQPEPQPQPKAAPPAVAEGSVATLPQPEREVVKATATGGRRRAAATEPAPQFELYGIRIPEASRDSANKVVEEARAAAQRGGSAAYQGARFGKHMWRPSIYDAAYREEVERLARLAVAVPAPQPPPSQPSARASAPAPEASPGSTSSSVVEQGSSGPSADLQASFLQEAVSDEPSLEDITFGDEGDTAHIQPPDGEFPFELFEPDGPAPAPESVWNDPYKGKTAPSLRLGSRSTVLPSGAAQEVRRLQEGRPSDPSVVPLPRRPGSRSASG